jgi:CHASE2 domain-containing sensor protein
MVKLYSTCFGQSYCGSTGYLKPKNHNETTDIAAAGAKVYRNFFDSMSGYQSIAVDGTQMPLNSKAGGSVSATFLTSIFYGSIVFLHELTGERQL